MLSRGKGILLPVFSLPGRENIGTFGAPARFFIDFLKETGQDYWQILPLSPAGQGNSPYCARSAFAGNEMFVDLFELYRGGLLKKEDVKEVKNKGRVDYKALKKEKAPLLLKAAQEFRENEDYFRFLRENDFWLDFYADFLEKKEKIPSHLTKITQFFFFSQWQEVQKYAAQNGIKIIGDLPFYVGANSVDIISNPENFAVGRDLTPTLVSGVPPDEFSENGQLWGTPVYNFNNQRKNGYAWWKKRMEQAARLYDCIRLDHFRAFSAFYAVPGGDKNAKGGQWIKGEGVSFFEKIKETISRIEIIAEDLGQRDAALEELLQKTGFPTMKVLQFAFNGDENNPFLPENFEKNCVCYTGTHDNDTLFSWYKNADEKTKKQFLSRGEGQGFTPNEKMITLAMQSRAETAIIPLADYLELDSVARINTPASVGEHNWSWRVKTSAFTDDLKEKIIRLSRR